MAHVDLEFLDKTVAFWQPRTTRRLTREDARQIIENATGFIRVLAEWDAKAGAAQPSASTSPEASHG
jgi:hypothetical protein